MRNHRCNSAHNVRLLGILGVLLAIPTAAAIEIVLRAWWANRTHAEPAPAS
jgi:predicted PurR-regulated permease PerM